MRLRMIALALAGVSSWPMVAMAQQAPAPEPAQPTTAPAAEAAQPAIPPAAATQPAPAAATTPPPPTEPGSGLTDIVVTAQRREESLQKVPVAVTAISAAKLDDLRIVSAQSLTGIAPSLSLLSQGRASSPTILLRGVYSGTSSNSVDPKVGVYIDGVYIGRSVGSLFDLADIARVEVLRGPQGTLFGRNATAGAISITTAIPTGKFGVEGSASYGNSDAKRLKVGINLPAVGPFSARVSYLHDQIDGEYDNLLAGRSIDLSTRDASLGTMRLADRLGGRNIDAVQAAVRGDFGAVTADYRFDYADARTVGRPIQAFAVPDTATAALTRAILAFQPLYGGVTDQSTGRLTSFANSTSRERVVTQGHSLTLTASDPDNGITVKSISSFRKLRMYPNTYDYAASGGLRFTAAQLGALLQGDVAGVLANPPGPNDSFSILTTAREIKQKQLTQEFQVLLTKDLLDLTAGVFIFHENSPSTELTGIFQPFANGVAVVDPTFDAIFGSGVTRTRAINDSFAGYAQATFHVAPTFDLTAGGRYTFDDRESQIISASAATGSTLGTGTFKARYEKFTYALIATWRPTDDTTAYGKFSTGYVSGGIFNALPYGPETLKTAEVGLKTQFFDNRVRANIAAYYSWYDALQFESFTNGVQTVTNVGNAKVKGVEVEVEAVPVTGLTLSGNFSLNDFNYRTYIGIDSLGVSRDIADVTIPVYSPRYQARTSIQYDAPAFDNGAHLFARVDGTYRSSISLVSPVFEVPDPTNAAQVANTALVNDLQKRPPLFLLNARAGVADWDVGGSKLALSVFGQNLTDKQYIAFGANVLRIVGVRERGRTYGVELGFKF